MLPIAKTAAHVYSGEIQQHTLTSASSGERPQPALAGTAAIRPALPLVRDEEARARCVPVGRGTPGNHGHSRVWIAQLAALDSLEYFRSRANGRATSLSGKEEAVVMSTSKDGGQPGGRDEGLGRGPRRREPASAEPSLGRERDRGQGAPGRRLPARSWPWWYSAGKLNKMLEKPPRKIRRWIGRSRQMCARPAAVTWAS